jgi:hypothetical protein
VRAIEDVGKAGRLVLGGHRFPLVHRRASPNGKSAAIDTGPSAAVPSRKFGYRMLVEFDRCAPSGRINPALRRRT